MKSLFLISLLSISSLQAEQAEVRGWCDIAPQEYPEFDTNFIAIPEKENGLLQLAEIAEKLEPDDHAEPEDSEWLDLTLLYKLGKPIANDRLRRFLDSHAAASKKISEIASDGKLQHPANPSETEDYQALLMLMRVAEFLKLEHHYHVTNGNIDEAVNTISTLQKLNNKLVKIDGITVSLLVAHALNTQASELIFITLKHPSLTTAHLQTLSSQRIHHAEFQRFTTLSIDYEFQFGERNIRNLCSRGPKQDALIDQIFDFDNELSAIFGGQKASDLESSIQKKLFKIAINLGVQPNKTINRAAQNYSTLKRDIILPVHLQKKDPLTDSSSTSICNFLGVLLLSPVNSSYYKVSSEYAINDAILLQLIALRHYQLEEGSLPDTLDQLIPAYLEKLPLDPYSGKPLLYSKEQNLVWSIGEDFKSNNGVSQASLEKAEAKARAEARQKKRKNASKKSKRTRPSKYARHPSYINHSEHLNDKDEPHIVVPF